MDERLTAYYFDLDDFKALNDVGGHELGDKALKVFSDGLHQRFHYTDLVGRLGCDEFMVLSRCNKREKDSQAAVEPIDKLNRYIDDSPLSKDDAPALRYSWGATDFKVSSDIDFDRILRRADDAMYDQKKSIKSALS
jgi:FOG: GGDEF domain